MEKEIISKNGKYKIEICEEWEKLENPCENDEFWNGFKFLLNPRSRYFYPRNCSENIYDYIDGNDETEDFLNLQRIFGKGNVFTLSAYIHGSVHLILGTCASGWDSGVIGYIVFDPKESYSEFSKEYTKEQHAKAFVDAWNHYMNEADYFANLYEKIELFDAHGNSEGEKWKLVDTQGGYNNFEDCESDALAQAEFTFGKGCF